ncbi:condensation domain-containing protein [Lentzea sp. NPDC004782]|uniref:condensation domain-containing protein n=1 Tax=Lentzea sp. NPDC004782 TaxID=3154458 RepID=UPI0033A79463
MSPVVEDVYRLTSLQEGLVLHCLRDPDPELFVGQLACRLSSEFDHTALLRAHTALLEAHPVLRTSFHTGTNGQLSQVVHRDVAAPTRSCDLTSHRDPETALVELLRDDRGQGFDLKRPALSRVTLVKMPGSRDVLVWTFHHLVLDGWSAHLALNDLLDAYDAVCRGREVRLPHRRPYRDYVAWLGRQDPVDAEECFQFRLGDVRTPTVLPDVVRGAQQERYAGQRIGLSPERTEIWRAAAQRARVTLSTLIQAAWGLTVSRFSGVTDVVFGTTLAVRPPELEGADRMVGLLLNTLPTRIRATPERNVLDWLSDVHKGQLELQQHAWAPLSTALACTGVVGGLPLFETTVVVENYPIDSSGWRQSAAIERIDYHQRANDPLTLLAIEGPGLDFVLSHDRTRYADDFVLRLLDHVVDTLNALAEGLDGTLADLVTVPRSPSAPSGDDGEPMAFQVNSTVICGHQRLRHDELESRANQVAHWLLGAVDRAPVEVRMPCSADSVVAVLGALKAGRPLAFAGGTARVRLDDATVFAGQPTTPPDVDVLLDDPACTWTDVATHRDILRAASDVIELCEMTAADVILSLAPLSSVTSVAYLIGCLTAGATFVQAGDRLDAEEIFGAMARHGVTCVAGVTPHDLRRWAPGTRPSTVRVVVCDGDGVEVQDRATGLFGPHTRVVDRYLPLAWPIRSAVRANGTVDGDRFVVLDHALNPAPIDAVGDVHVDGHRTGDRGRRTPDGTIELLAAATDPSVIAARLRSHPLVTDAVVSLQGDRLVAHVVAGTESVVDELRRSAGDIPVVRVAQIPVVPSGQPDTAALAAIGLPDEHDDTPATDDEIAVAGIFAEILGVRRIGLHDSFFDLGGRSLDALRMIALASDALGAEVPIEALFDAPTVSGILLAVRSQNP